MLTVYIVAAVMGGVLVLAAALGGGDGHVDHSADTGVEISADTDTEVDVHASAPTDGGGLAPWLPFLSLRFWTYFIAFFGLAGLLLSSLTLWGGVAVAVASTGVGFTTGFGVATFMRLMARTEADSGVASADMIGAEGAVLLPVRAGEVGKVRVQIKGDVIDLLARADDEEPLDIGTDIIIVGFRDSTATVIRREDLVKRLSADRRAVLAARKTAKP